MPQAETIVALSTPAGESAIGVVRLSGPLVDAVAAGAMSRAKNALPPPRHATFAQYHDVAGRFVDEVVITRYAAKRSFTGEAMLEISCHGNMMIVDRIIGDCLRRGCRLAQPGEFTRTAFMNGRIDLSQAEAISDIIRARSDLALEVARRQLRGAIGRTVSKLSAQLLRIIAHFEAYLDFPEEDLPPENAAGPLADLQSLIRELGVILENSHYRILLDEGIKTVILGAPNVGKSSLINLLTGEERAIVSALPGTTRDYLKERIRLGAYCIQILDTAGLHPPESDLESLGIRKTLEQIEVADFYLVVLDSTQASPTLPDAVMAHLRPDNTLVLENKTDLNTSAPRPDFLPEVRHVRLSMKTHDGYEAFREAWLKCLGGHSFTPPPDQVVVNARHANAIRVCRERLKQARAMSMAAEESILVVSELREALDQLGEVVGKIDNEAMLDILFRDFCIGK